MRTPVTAFTVTRDRTPTTKKRATTRTSARGSFLTRSSWRFASSYAGHPSSVRPCRCVARSAGQAEHTLSNDVAHDFAGATLDGVGPHAKKRLSHVATAKGRLARS